MHTQHDAVPMQPITLTLEVVPEDPLDSDPALVDVVGRATADALRSDGYVVQPISTGTRGGLLVEIIAFLSQALAAAWANKEALIADMSGVVTILSAVATVVTTARHAYEKRVGTASAQQYPISFTLEINGMTVPFAVADLASAEALFHLAERLQASHPALTGTNPSRSNTRVKATVPRQPRR